MAAKFNLNLHKRFLITILIEIFKSLEDKIAFKGGTCALLFYDLNRFSFDLDFDILKPFIKQDLSKVKNALLKNGNIKDFYEKKFTTFFLFDYQRNYPNIKIEFNKRIWQNNHYKTVWFMGVRMQITDEQTLFTNKLVALTTRKQAVARDLFDVYYFLNLDFAVNEDLIKERTGKGKTEYLRYLIKFIKNKYTPRNVLQGLGETLDAGQKQWAKQELIAETIKKLKNKL